MLDKKEIFKKKEKIDQAIEKVKQFGIKDADEEDIASRKKGKFLAEIKKLSSEAKKFNDILCRRIEEVSENNVEVFSKIKAELVLSSDNNVEKIKKILTNCEQVTKTFEAESQTALEIKTVANELVEEISSVLNRLGKEKIATSDEVSCSTKKVIEEVISGYLKTIKKFESFEVETKKVSVKMIQVAKILSDISLENKQGLKSINEIQVIIAGIENNIIKNIKEIIDSKKVQAVSIEDKSLAEIEKRLDPRKVEIKKKPSWYKEFSFSELLDTLASFFQNRIINIRAGEHEDPKNALAVKIIDSKGSVISDLKPIINLNPGGGGGFEQVYLKDEFGNVISPAINKRYSQKVDAVDANTTYIGYCAMGSGTNTAGAVWRIKKVAVAGVVTTITWADGDDNFDNIWDNRAALSYS